MAAPHPSLLHLVRGRDFPSSFRVTMEIANSAIEHGLGPLLDEMARSQGLDGDHQALLKLTMHRLDSAAGTRAALDALETLTASSSRFGIDIAAFKGLTIGSRWYPKPDLRPAVDVDIFVNSDSRHLLGAWLASLGAPEESAVTIDAMVAERRVFEHTVSVQGVPIDVHIDPINLLLPTSDSEVLWRHTQPITLPNGSIVRALDLELSLVQGLIHLFRDNFADLLHINDIGLMMESDPDWDLIAVFAESEGWTDLIRSSLGFVCDVLGRESPLPEDLTMINSSLIHTIWPARIRLRGGDSLTRSYRRDSMVGLLTSGRRAELAAALWRRLFPPRSVIDLRFGATNNRYPVALYRWRRTQRAEILRQRRTSLRHRDTRQTAKASWTEDDAI